MNYNHEHDVYVWVVTYYNKKTGEIGSRGVFLQESQAKADIALAMNQLGDDYIFNMDQLEYDYIFNLMKFKNDLI